MQTNFSLSVLRSYITEKTHLFLLLSYWDQVGHIKPLNNTTRDSLSSSFFTCFQAYHPRRQSMKLALLPHTQHRMKNFWEWGEKIGGKSPVMPQAQAELMSSVDGTNYVTSAFKLLLILISSFPMSFSPSLGCYFGHLITTFTGKKPYFHIKGNRQEIQDLMGEKCWVSALPISCSFRMRTGKQR